MPGLVIVGAQWGDEGKGKIVDFLSEGADVVVRFQGGNNAGHTIVHDGKEHFLHIVPSGVIRGRTSVIGNGVVLDLEVLSEEMIRLRAAGIEPDLRISDRAHLILPYHRIIDGVVDRSAGIGTTKRGIGPAYADKAYRVGLRVADLFSPDLEGRLERCMRAKEALLVGMGVDEPLPAVGEVAAKLRRLSREIAPMVCDTSEFLEGRLRQGQNVLFEGAQGVLLDTDFGTYPFVTSSSTCAGGASTGTGVPPRHLTRVVGVVKAYQTRVGEGPMPTEFPPDIAEAVRVKGGEYGVTTGRPRRCGDLDLVALRHSIRVGGITSIALTKADVLGELDAVKVATSYVIGGKRWTSLPADAGVLARAKPVYEELAPWSDIDRKAVAAEGYGALPAELRAYVSFIERSTDTPIDIVSYGPARSETVVVRDPWS